MKVLTFVLKFTPHEHLHRKNMNSTHGAGKGEQDLTNPPGKITGVMEVLRVGLED